MINIKKLAIIIILICAFLLSGCGEKQKVEPAAPAQPSEPAVEPPAPELIEEPEPVPEQEAEEPETVEPEEPEQEMESQEVEAEEESSEIGYSLAKCDHLTLDEIKDEIPFSFKKMKLATTVPEGCTVTYLSENEEAFFNFKILDYSAMPISPIAQMQNVDCKEGDATIGEEVGRKSCRRTTASSRDILFAKDMFYVQLSTNLADVSFDSLLELAKIAEPRIE